MPTYYQLNDINVFLCDFLPSEDVDTSKYVKVFEPSQRASHKGRELIVRKSKLETIKATNPFERLQETMQ